MTEQDLINKHPHILEHCGRSRKHDEPIAWWGIECEEGWFETLDWLMTEIEKIDPDHTVKVTQIKEKFGGLRFYINSGSDEVYKLINKAEEKCSTICEYCGRGSGRRRSGGWIKILCDECEEQRKKNMH